MYRAFPGSSPKGFTLLEVLVALTVLSLVLTAIYAGLTTDLGGFRRAADYEQALLLAESKLNAIGIEKPLVEGDTFGHFNAKFRWQASVVPFIEEGLAPVEEVVRPVTVRVIVSWDDVGSSPQISLVTLRLIPRVSEP